ncbi:MAG: SDR family oxidoreductase [Phycisphaerae bacterium]|nr:SDR family oxidoreductase [Phycisphaerae bacterium]
MARKTVLVTGGTGFIGSHLCLRLFDEGHHVICLDNCFTGKLENLRDRRCDNMNHRRDGGATDKMDHRRDGGATDKMDHCRDGGATRMMLSGRFEFIRHDVVEPITLEVDEIYHLACPASPVHYQHNPIKTIKTNVFGTYHMLGLAKRTGARILLASTSEIYGDPQVHPQTEDYWGNVNSIGIRSCYDEGKRVAETLASDYHRQHDTDIRIARIFNTYGPNMSVDDGRVMSNFICQALRNEPITVYGDGRQTRSFCYVSDLVEGLCRLMACDHTKPVNLGNDREITMLELVGAIEAALGRKLEVVHKPLPQDDPTRRRPDLTLARRLFAYEPAVSLEQGISNTIDYFRRALGTSDA